MLPFSSSWSVPALNGLDRAHACREGRSMLLSAPSHLLISAGSSFTDTPRNNVSSVHPVIQSGWHPNLTMKVLSGGCVKD